MSQDVKHWTSPGPTAAKLGISYGTLNRWRNENYIEWKMLPSGRYKYNASSVCAPIEIQTKKDGDHSKTEKGDRKKVIYCRVSSPPQRPHLENQVRAMQAKYPDHIVIKDIGSGINFKRRGLLTLLDGIVGGTIQEVVVAHRDRLCRFAFDLVEWIAKRHGTRIVVESDPLHTSQASPKSDLVEDLLAIVHVFASRFHGLRKYERAIGKTAQAGEPPKEASEVKLGKRKQAEKATTHEKKAKSRRT